LYIIYFLRNLITLTFIFIHIAKLTTVVIVNYTLYRIRVQFYCGQDHKQFYVLEPNLGDINSSRGLIIHKLIDFLLVYSYSKLSIGEVDYKHTSELIMF
jgi:hypothetical protein